MSREQGRGMNQNATETLAPTVRALLDSQAGDYVIIALSRGDEWGPTVAFLRDNFGLRRKPASDLVEFLLIPVERAGEPCKHPARRGEHEWYGDRLHTDHPRWLCRACGARAIGDLPKVFGEART